MSSADPFELLPVLETLLPEPPARQLTEPVAGGQGFQELLTPSSPAAGAEYVYTVSGTWNERPLSVWAKLTTSAAAGSRQVVLEFRNGEGRRYLIAGADVFQGVSVVQEYNFQAGAAEAMWSVDDVAVLSFPPTFLWPTYRLAVRVLNMDAGDQLSGLALVLERYTTAPPREPAAPSPAP